MKSFQMPTSEAFMIGMVKKAYQEGVEEDIIITVIPLKDLHSAIQRTFSGSSLVVKIPLLISLVVIHLVMISSLVVGGGTNNSVA